MNASTVTTTTGWSTTGLHAKSHAIKIERRALPGLDIVGLADGVSREARVRIRSALVRLEALQGGVTLTITDGVKAFTTGFDLPLALLAVGKDLPAVGELSMEGIVRPVRGILPIAEAMKAQGAERIYVAAENAREAALSGLQVFVFRHLRDAVQGREERYFAADYQQPQDRVIDFSQCAGHERAIRALEIAAAGHHHILLVGGPGAGKTMLARRVPDILPPLTQEEALELTRLASVAGLNIGAGLVSRRPFRAPHHSTSSPGLVGGGAPQPRPGELSLASAGVLFLDQFTEFLRQPLEMLREPLATNEVTLTRSTGTVSFPARALVIAAMQPCPCGYYRHPKHSCRCSAQTRSYSEDRARGHRFFDMRAEVDAVDLAATTTTTETSASIRLRVAAARAVQMVRQGKLNHELQGEELDEHCFRGAVRVGDVDRMTYDRLRRVARTIADLEGSAAIGTAHVEEAHQLTANL